MGQVSDLNSNAQLTEWITDRTALEEPLRFDAFTNGKSNLTYAVTGSNGLRVVLRRPPLHSVLASAHDVAREFRIVHALQSSAIPLPRTIGLETRSAIIGAPFFVMSHVDGVVIRDRTSAAQLSSGARATIGDDLVDTLAAIHMLDLNDVGLDKLGRHEDYIGRQLRRWLTQVRASAVRDTSIIESVADRLAGRIPVQERTSLVHGDFRIENAIVDPAAGNVKAILDWELATLGDPLADLGWLAAYWVSDRTAVVPHMAEQPSRAQGFRPRDQVVERYARATGLEVGSVDYYIAFSQWRLSCILQGVYSRMVGGAYGATDDDPEEFGDAADDMASLALATLDRGP